MSDVVQKRMDDKQGKDNCDNKTVRCPIRGGSTRLMHYRWFREGQEVIYVLVFLFETAFHIIFCLCYLHSLHQDISAYSIEMD